MGVVYGMEWNGMEWNGMEAERKYTGDVQVIERQTAELAFHFNGTERKLQRFYASYCSSVYMHVAIPTCM